MSHIEKRIESLKLKLSKTKLPKKVPEDSNGWVRMLGYLEEQAATNYELEGLQALVNLLTFDVKTFEGMTYSGTPREICAQLRKTYTNGFVYGSFEANDGWRIVAVGARNLIRYLDNYLDNLIDDDFPETTNNEQEI